MNDVSRIHLAARMAHIEAFEVMEIQTLAREVEAGGRDVIHLEIGEPDFTTPRLGLMELREAISKFYRERYKVEVPAARIIVTAGSSVA